MIRLDYTQAVSVLDPIMNYFGNSPLELKRFQLITGEASPSVAYNNIHTNAEYAHYMLQRFMTYTFSPRNFRKGTIAGEPFTQDAYNNLRIWGVSPSMYEALRYYAHIVLVRQHFDGKYARLGKKMLNYLKRLVRPEYYQSVIANCKLLDKNTNNDIKAMQIQELSDLLSRYTGDMRTLLTKVGMTEAQRNLMGYA